MAKIIAVANTKGGTGKSHLSVNLSVVAAIAGHKVLLIDADPQASSAKFANVRDTERPSFVCIELTQPNLHKQLQTLSEPYDYVFIDVGGRDAPVLRSAVGAADIILVPMIPSAADSWAADDIFAVFDSLTEFGAEPDIRVVLNMQASTIIARDALSSIKSKIEGRQIQLLQTSLRHRTAWPRSFGEGLSVVEWQSSGAAAQELRALADELGITNEGTNHNPSQS